MWLCVIYNVYYIVYYCVVYVWLFDVIVWIYCVMLIWFYIVFVCGLCDLVDVILSAVVRLLFGYVQMVLWWLCPDFIVIDVIYYFLIAYNVWLYIYVFRRILLFLYVVECWFSLVFIGFMPFMVLWSYFLFMQNFTIVHSRMYRRTENTP